jgi:hypothetical protein
MKMKMRMKRMKMTRMKMMRMSRQWCSSPCLHPPIVQHRESVQRHHLDPGHGPDPYHAPAPFLDPSLVLALAHERSLSQTYPHRS